MTRVGLVLGAGGIVGQAYHAGALAALEHDLGWDPRTADVVVGSSAGSVTGTGLRLGVPARDLAAWAVESPLTEEGAPVLEALGTEPPDFPPFDPRRMLRPWRLPSAALLSRTARRPWAFRPSVAAVTMLPSGQVDLSEHVGVLDELVGEAWLDGLWVCAVRRSDGRRVTFGRPGAPPARLSEAVAASCAIPGYFRPVRVGATQYLDGGVHSSTNADVLVGQGLDVVVVLAPMSAAHGVARTADAPMRWSTHSRLQREVRRLKADGVTVVRIEPGARALAAMGVNAMAADRSQRVVEAAFLETGRHATTPTVAARLAVLATRPSRRRLAA